MTRAKPLHTAENIIGSSPEMDRVRNAIARVAGTRATVLLSGESGTGKELVARAIHDNSERAGGPFVRLHCGGVPEDRQEGEIFGSDGEAEPRASRFTQAHGGTLFLDEIEQMSQGSQVRLLGVLEEHEVEQNGSSIEQIDVRVVAATDKILKELVDAGRFRDDLFYRLKVIDVRMPALRERPSDIPELASHFLRFYAEQNKKPIREISDAALDLMKRYAWPGNVRELENVIEHAVVVADGTVIETRHLPAELAAPKNDRVPTVPGATIDELERYAILKTLEAVGGSTSKAAEKLGISVRKIQYKLQEYGSSGRGL